MVVLVSDESDFCQKSVFHGFSVFYLALKLIYPRFLVKLISPRFGEAHIFCMKPIYPRFGEANISQILVKLIFPRFGEARTCVS